MGQIVEYIKIALMNIRHNKGRSILTMLGIIIGIASVIMIISVGNGLHNSVSGELNSIAGGQIYVSISDQESGKEFTQADIEAVKENVKRRARRRRVAAQHFARGNRHEPQVGPPVLR